MKTFILGANVEATVVAKQWLVKGTTSGVKPAAGAIAALGLAETSVATGGKVGVIKKALMKVTAAAATYVFGDTLELDATGQVATAYTSNPVVATAAEDLVLSADGDLLVYVNL